MQFSNHQDIRSPRPILRHVAAFGVVAAFCAAAHPVFGEPLPSWNGLEEHLVRVRQEARAPGVGGAARVEAVAAAQKAVFVHMLESILGEDEATRLIPLLGNPARYLHSTRVLREDYADGATMVEIEAFVRATDLRNHAAALVIRRLPLPPKALVLAAEQIGDDRPVVTEDATAYRVLCEALSENHIAIADASKVRERYAAAELIRRIRGDLDTARRFAQENLVDVVLLVHARAQAEPDERGTNVSRNQATVTVRLFRSRDGKLLEAATATAAVYGADPREGGALAIEDACTKVRHAIVVAAILEGVDAPAQDNIIVTIKAVGSRARLREIRAALSEYAPVKAVDELYYSEEEARFRVQCDGPMGPLVDHLAKRDYPGFALDTRLVVAQTMTFAVVEF